MAGGATRNARKSRKRRNSEDSTSAAASRTLKQYSVDEKLEIIEFAKGNGNRAAGREYNVAESSIREWRKNEEKLRAVNNVEQDKNGSDDLVRKLSLGPLESHRDDKGPEYVQVSLSTSLQNVTSPSKANGTITPPQTIDMNEVGPSTSSSSSSSHSNSPVTTGLSSSSSRRKAKMPRKMIIDP